MKSYDETIRTVLDKIEMHHRNQKRNRRIILSAAIPVCLSAICITGLWIYEKSQTDTPNYSLEVPSPTVSMDSTFPPTSPVNMDPVTQPTENNDRIIINSIGEVSESIMNIALHRNDEIIMTLEELCQYYGTDIIPDIPGNLTKQEGETYRIYKRNNGTGEIYWDQNIQRFLNEDNTKGILVETRKGRLPFHDIVIYDPKTENSIINGVEVAIGLSEYGYYCIWFMYKNTGFYICSEGITQEELITVIKSLTD